MKADRSLPYTAYTATREGQLPRPNFAPADYTLTPMLGQYDDKNWATVQLTESGARRAADLGIVVRHVNGPTARVLGGVGTVPRGFLAVITDDGGHDRCYCFPTVDAAVNAILLNHNLAEAWDNGEETAYFAALGLALAA